MRMRMRMELELFEEGELERLFQQAIQVWREISFRIQGTDEFFDYLRGFGCRVDGERVWFPEGVIEETLARVAAEKEKWLGESGGKEEWPASKLEMFTHGQALHICDLESNELRPATEADLVAWCHLVDALGVELRTHPTFIPTDVARGAADFHTFATIILNSRRAHRVSVYSARMLPFFIEAWRLSEGSIEAVERDPVFAAKCWVNAPCMITRENIEVAMEARRLLGTPVTFGHMPVAGAAGPITVAGSLVQNTAESLALNAMSLAIDNRTQGITSTSALIDMKDLAHRQSGPDLALHMLAGSEMHAHLFGGRPRIGISGVAAPTVSPQSVYEKGMSAAFNIAAGQRQLGIGCLAFSDVGSPVQLVLDHEMGGYFRHLFREVDAGDEHVGLETILETIPRGAFFLESEQTARFFREECWLPAFVDHRVPLAWARDPSDMIERARVRARELRDAAENLCPLPETTRKQIRELIKEADALVETD